MSSRTPEKAPDPDGLESTETEELHPDQRQARVLLLLTGLGILIGVPAALLAWGFLEVVHLVEHWLWVELPSLLGADRPPWYLLIGLPALGAGIVVVARRFLPGDGGHHPLQGFGGPPTPWQNAFGVALAALGGLAFGAVLGPEAPLIALGSAVGMAVTPFVRLPKQGQVVLANAGSFSAISALFGGPLVAGILLLEAGLAAGTKLIPALLPGVAAAATGYVLFTGLGDWGGLTATPLEVSGLPEYQGTRVLDLILALVVGVVAAIIVGVVRRSAQALEDVTDPAPEPRKWVLLVLGGLAVGVLAWIAQALGANPQDVLFSGQSSMPDLVAETSVWLLLVLIVAKGIAYGISLGSGFRGGPVFPAVFIGVAVAMVLALGFDSSPTWALVVGAAVGMTAGTGLVFSSLALAMMLGGGAAQDAMPAAVFGVLAAWFTTAAMKRRTERRAAPVGANR
jgi:chloride channel protein, CIC family